MIGLAHAAVCVADVDAAAAWYATALGMRVLSPPYLMEGPRIEADMGALVPAPVAVKAAIVGFADGDHVLELVEYPNAPGDAARRADAAVHDPGISHIGLVVEDIEATRSAVAEHGAELLTDEVASIAGVRTAWIRDPFGVVFILVEKRHADRPYWRQWP